MHGAPHAWRTSAPPIDRLFGATWRQLRLVTSELRFTLQLRKLCSSEVLGVTEAQGVIQFPSARSSESRTSPDRYV